MCILPVDEQETTGEGKALACLEHSSYMNCSQCSNCIHKALIRQFETRSLPESMKVQGCREGG